MTTSTHSPAKTFSYGPQTRLLALSAVMATVTLLYGCAATQVAIQKRDLDIQTKLSATIFLDPVAPEEMTIFVQVRNTSDKQELDLAPDIVAAVTAKGYRIVRDPKQAKFYLQANVLQVGKTDPTAIQQQLGGGYGGAIAGMAIAGATGSNGRGVMGGALIGGAAELIAGNLVKDVYYSIVTDLQIKERLVGGKKATLKSQHANKQGTSGAENVTYSDEVDMKTYQTRIVSTANKVNLEFAEAAPALRSGLTRALTGLF